MKTTSVKRGFCEIRICMIPNRYLRVFPEVVLRPWDISIDLLDLNWIRITFGTHSKYISQSVLRWIRMIILANAKNKKKQMYQLWWIRILSHYLAVQNRWIGDPVTHSVTSEWWGNMTWPKFGQIWTIRTILYIWICGKGAFGNLRIKSETGKYLHFLQCFFILFLSTAFLN